YKVLSAYVHPCASRGRMLLIDSDYERQTLAQLRSVQSWLRRRCGVLTTIDKPLFDLRPPASTDDAPRPPLIPDFLVGVVGPGGVRRNVVVETMGWSEPLYRERKERLHAEMAQVCGPVVMHDFHQPADADQAWRDNVFWRALRDALAERWRPELAGDWVAGLPAVHLLSSAFCTGETGGGRATPACRPQPRASNSAAVDWRLTVPVECGRS